MKKEPQHKTQTSLPESHRTTPLTSFMFSNISINCDSLICKVKHQC